MAWVSAHEVLARWVGEGAPGEATVDQWIADAETLIRFEYPDIDVRIADEVLPLDRVQLVVSRVVIRALRNPDNVRVTNIGAAGVTYAGDRPGGLQLTEDDRAMLGETSGPSRARAFTIDTTPIDSLRAGYWAQPDLWVPYT